ncbi:glycoside hydrolase family 97 protein [Compostimonas suwonensis]|uniref:Glycosyl hydrolase family 97 n=1 Tax=Compostimonas suwonensis TaxID=1048394 RepID=A0A2M9C085_9MICO|nr:glycoside hydrolase family 97 protein [Compostimonas suwonensis]PJJ63757.1 glycosyl hydrolase family 97 [Compostimonas suwonensis]
MKTHPMVARRGIRIGAVAAAAALVVAGVTTTTLLAHAAPDLTGAGTAADPYKIGTVDEFSSFISNVNADTAGTGSAAAHYALTSDIALTAPVPMINSFGGVLDGTGHTVFGLSIDFTGSKVYASTGGADKTAALINNNSGTIERVGFSGVSITGTSSAESQTTNTKKATVVANNHGLVDQVYVMGSIDGGWRTAGIVADNLSNGVIQNSYFRGSIHSGWESGGIAARNDNVGTERITNVYADATMVTETRNIGIISGYSYSTATIRGAVALGGSVAQGSGQSANNIGRINGQNNTSVASKGATYVNNLALATLPVSGAAVTGGAADNRQGLNKSAAELAQQATYEAIGWDFAGIWTFDQAAQRPVLTAVPEKAEPDEPTEPTDDPTDDPTEPGDGLASEVVTTSPDGKTVATVSTDDEGNLGYTVTQDGATVVRESDLGLVIGGTDWGTGVTLGTATTSAVDESYPLIGHQDTGRDHNNTSVIPVLRDDASVLSLEFEVFDTGIALRYVLDPSLAGAVVSREDTTFAFDPASTLNYQVVTSGTIDDLQNSFSRNTFAAAGAQNITVLPTVELPDGHFANVTEAKVLDWPAIALKTTSTGSISTYYWATDNRQGTFAVKPETLHSPFRVITIADNLTDLTNSDIVTAVNDPIDTSVFPGGDLSWIRPGTNSWATQTTNDQSLTGMQSLLDSTADAGITGILIEGNLTDASWGANTAERFANIAALVQRGKSKTVPVDVWLWTDYDKGAGADTTFTNAISYDSGSSYARNSLQNPDFREAYLDLVKQSGLAGLKVDHTNEETETKVNFFRDMARDSAARQLMVIFHNPLEPTGQNRTYPNELGREAIRGLQSGYDANQDVLAPFTRLIAGPADFTPFQLSGSGWNVSWAHQLASTVVYTMPYMQLSERPAYLAPGGQYHDLVGNVIENLPTTWKRSWMLPQSKIGSLAAVARETADGEYWIAVTSGTTAPGQLSIPLDFLPAGTTYNVDLYADKTVAVGMSRTTTTVDSTSTLTPTLRSGGGFLARITTDAIDNPLEEDGSTGPYDISSEADLALIAQHPAATFNVTADITMTRPWTPVASFDGTINGNGHKISGLEVAGSESKAFIMTNAGTIRQLGFIDATAVIPGAYIQANRVAVVTVANFGLIDQVFVIGSEVSGGWRSAPIAAENNAEIRNSYTVDANARANWEVGGLVAWNSSSALLQNNYVASATVKADVQNGGILTGYGYTGTRVIGNVVVSGTVQTTNSPRARVLARENGSPSYTDNLSLDTATVNGSLITNGTATNLNGANRTAAQLAQQSTYEAIGWDFGSVWTFDAQLGRAVLTAVSETPDAPADTDDQQVEVTVPEQGTGEPGEFVWNIDGTNGLVNLGTAEQDGDHFAATGSINPVRVTDTRTSAPQWSISAQVGDFANGDTTFSGKYLGWTPLLVEAGGGAAAGNAVASGFLSGDGLSASSTLGLAANGHELGSAKLGADLDLRLPLEVANGTYQATLTLTALG